MLFPGVDTEYFLPSDSLKVTVCTFSRSCSKCLLLLGVLKFSYNVGMLICFVSYKYFQLPYIFICNRLGAKGCKKEGRRVRRRRGWGAPSHCSPKGAQGCCLTGTQKPGAPKLRVWATKFLFKEPGWAPKHLFFILIK